MVALYTPVLRGQIRALESGGAASAEFRRLSARGALLGAMLGVDVIAIVFLMVTKPTL